MSPQVRLSAEGKRETSGTGEVTERNEPLSTRPREADRMREHDPTVSLGHRAAPLNGVLGAHGAQRALPKTGEPIRTRTFELLVAARANADGTRSSLGEALPRRYRHHGCSQDRSRSDASLHQPPSIAEPLRGLDGTTRQLTDSPWPGTGKPSASAMAACALYWPRTMMPPSAALSASRRCIGPASCPPAAQRRRRHLVRCAGAAVAGIVRPSASSPTGG